MIDFKLQFYFNKYKDKAMPTRAEFRLKFKRLHGEFESLEDLIIMIENYQMKKYGTTLYSWDNRSDERYEARCLGIEEEKKVMKGMKKNVY